MYDKPYRRMYGEVVELNIAKRKPFPDSRMNGILENTAKTANEIMTSQSFAGRRRKNVWSNRNRSGQYHKIQHLYAFKILVRGGL